MQNTPKIDRLTKNKKVRLKPTASVLLLLGGIAIVFALSIIQVQSSTSAYLAGLSIWTRGQSEAVRYANNFARTGDPAVLELARESLKLPIGDMLARIALEQEFMDYDEASRGFLQGGNHPDDIPRMIWLFHFFQNTIYFRDAVKVWRDSDPLIIELQHVLDKLEVTPRNPTDKLEKLQIELEQINKQLDQLQTDFRKAMSLASRSMTTIMSFATVIIFVLLGSIAALLLMRLTSEVRHSERKFRNTFENAAVGIAQIDSTGQILDANSALSSILDYHYNELIQLQMSDLVHQENVDSFAEQQATLQEGAGKDEGENVKVSFKQRLHRKDQSLVWVQTTMSRFKWDETDTYCYVCIFEDVSEQHRLSKELSFQARHDNLTGLINRRAFDGYLKEALIKARSENFIHSLCFIDLDQFKVINDTLGHLAGDQMLLQVTQLFSGLLRKSDLLARLGGDEFGLILDCCEPDQAVKMVETIRTTLNDLPFVWKGRSFNISCSIGVVPIQADSGTEAELLQAADSACHMAKEQGRNKVILTYQGDQELAARRIQMEWIERIRHAIEGNKLYLDAQELVALTPTLKTRIEVLVRMMGDNDEVIPPGAFIPAAERFGLMHLVDRWVIKHVCACIQSHAITLAQIGAIHINVSGKSFDHEDFIEFTLETINQYKIPANKLCFEITETAAVSNLAVVRKFMQKLGERGSTFALDDFGAGLSSFAYLKQLPVEYLKIDGAFVKNMADDDTDKAMVRAINDIGKTLGKVMVAEFVEDQPALDFLKNIGVEYGQGFYLHRPERFEGYISNVGSEH